jgi:hypothetical protein
MRLARIALAALATSGCFAVTDLNRFQQQAPTNPDFFDLEFSVRGMTSHVAEYFEVRLLDSEKNLISRAVFQPLGGEAAQISIPAAFKKRDSKLRLEFWADHNKNGILDAQPADHQWTLDLDGFKPDADGVVRVAFDHSPTFQDLSNAHDLGVTAVVHLKNLGAQQGKRMQLRVSDASSRQVVALYRVPSVSTPSFDATVKGIIDPAKGTRYRIEVSFDDGKGGAFEAYRLDGESGANTGLDVAFDPATAPKVTDVLPPSGL